jgi:hypothetical protein
MFVTETKCVLCELWTENWVYVYKFGDSVFKEFSAFL